MTKKQAVPIIAGNAPSLANRALAEAIAGAGGGVLSMALCYPLMTISTRQQVQKKKAESVATTAPAADGEHKAEGGAPAAPVAAADKATYGGLWHTVQKIIAEEGVGGLYAGLSSALFGGALTQFVYYGAYSWTKATAQKMKYGGQVKELSVGGNMVVGAIAGLITSVVTHPVWTINTRQMTRAKAGSGSSSFWKTMYEVYNEEGLAGLFQGLGPALVLVINPTIQYMVFSKVKEAYLRGRTRASALEVFVLGAIAKVAATLVTYPYILVKSCLQANHTGSGTLTATAVMSRILNEEGVLGFYKGLKSKIMQSVLMASFLFMFQDKLLAYTIRLVSVFMRGK